MKILWSRVLKIIKRVNIGNKDQFQKNQINLIIVRVWTWQDPGLPFLTRVESPQWVWTLLQSNRPVTTPFPHPQKNLRSAKWRWNNYVRCSFRQLEELCQQSPAGCIMQSEFSEDSTQNGKRKRKKSKKERKHGSRGRKNKRKMSTSSEINQETDETCPYVDPPTDDEDYEEDDGSECLKTQQIIGD